jgi:hypothetical protein
MMNINDRRAPIEEKLPFTVDRFLICLIRSGVGRTDGAILGRSRPIPDQLRMSHIHMMILTQLSGQYDDGHQR